MKKITLSQLSQGEKGRIIDYDGGCGLVNKLNAMGVRIGKCITIISDSFIGGPVTIQIGNSTISIGRGMAAKIIVKVDE